ncbi:interferon alpha-inducible protein 6 isoform X1 [Oryzias melastigma]|uniref:interferon alpha-inducible protein 6 isoform X1 n=1 Tax=Oryzias melastigma TaxID=30732 RepID=UPI000CF7F51D|nr:interferon alpha-inducible protein 6 isoform X1 [Oryzias melastigma]
MDDIKQVLDYFSLMTRLKSDKGYKYFSECCLFNCAGKVVAVAAGAVGAVALAPVALGAIGFTSGGVAAGSFAAGMMSSAAAANGGGVAAGSLVAALQSAENGEAEDGSTGDGKSRRSPLMRRAALTDRGGNGGRASITQCSCQVSLMEPRPSLPRGTASVVSSLLGPSDWF